MKHQLTSWLERTGGAYKLGEFWTIICPYIQETRHHSSTSLHLTQALIICVRKFGLIFLRFELPPNFIFQSYRAHTWQFYLFLLALSISGIYKELGIKFKGG